MTKVTFVSAALIAAAAFTTQAMAARSSDAAARRAATQTHTIADCVRAPNVGAFASAPYTVPPCMPNTNNRYVRRVGLADLASPIMH